MSRFYDKILLIISIALLLGSFGYFMTKGGPVIEKNLGDQEPNGEIITEVQVKPYRSTSLVWEEPAAQDEEGLWQYDVFTPPKIWWDSDIQQLVAQSPDTGPPVLEHFGIYLAELERMLYRIQFDAYFGGMGDPNNALIQFYDRETNETRRGKVGKEFSGSDFKILACTNEKEFLEGGTRSTVTRVTILDTRTNQEIELNSEKKHYLEGDYSIEFATTAEPYGSGQEFVLKTIGESFTIGADTFILVNFNFDNQSATIEKLRFEGEESEVKTLSVSKSSPSN